MFSTTEMMDFKLKSTSRNNKGNYQLPSYNSPVSSKPTAYPVSFDYMDFKLVAQSPKINSYEFPEPLDYTQAIINGLSHPCIALKEAVCHPFDTIVKPTWHMIYDSAVLSTGCGYVSFGPHAGLVKWDRPLNDFSRDAILKAEMNMDKRTRILNRWIGDTVHTIKHGSGPKRVELGVSLATQVAIDLLTEGVLFESRFVHHLPLNKATETLFLPGCELFGNLKEKAHHEENSRNYGLLFSPSFKLGSLDETFSSCQITMPAQEVNSATNLQTTVNFSSAFLPDFKLSYMPDDTFSTSSIVKSVLSQNIEPSAMTRTYAQLPNAGLSNMSAAASISALNVTPNSTAGMFAALNISSAKIETLSPPNMENAFSNLGSSSTYSMNASNDYGNAEASEYYNPTLKPM